MNIRKRIKNKNKTFLDNLMKAFLKQGHTWETFSYLRKENLLKEKREKVKNFRKRTFLEKPVRVQRECCNLIKKRIKDSGDIFYTDFSMEEEEKSWVDLFFLSKKYPNVFYNVEIVSSDCHVLDALEQLSFDYCFNENEKSFGFKINKLSKDEKQELFEELSKTQTNTSYQIHKDYVFGIGLHIKLNNGKKTFTKDEIIKVINNFWENGEVEIEPNYKRIEVDSEEMEEILYNFYKMCSLSKHVVKEKIFSFFKNKKFSKEEIDLAEQKIIKDYFESRNHLRMREKLYSETFNDLEYQRIIELMKQKEKEIAPQNKEELKKRLPIQISEKNKKINFEDLFINILTLLEKDQEKIEKYLDEVLKELSK